MKLTQRKRLKLEKHHIAWLTCHPDRTAEWLAERLADGFHVHHVDGDHGNDEPKNLALIEGLDHMLIFHGMKNYSPNAVAGRLGGKAKFGNMTVAQISAMQRKIARKRERAKRAARRQGEAHKAANAEKRAT